MSVAASYDDDFATEVQEKLSTISFRVYTHHDVPGVELGGVLKNVIAIGAGISDGLGFGDNTKAALVTRGLAEMRRLGKELGAEAETFYGVSGLGDLMATCTSSKSRNRLVGFELARGRSVADILQAMAPRVPEGVQTARAVLDVASACNVEMPISQAVHDMLSGTVTPRDAVRRLMSRAWRKEAETGSDTYAARPTRA